ncbi:MAG: porin, partial [Betaproteobacteria bacterium]
ITGVSYTTPAFSGTTVTLQHGGAHGNRTDRESTTDASDGLRRNKEARTGINIQHRAGPLYLGAAYESTAINRTTNSAATTNAYGGTVAAGSSSGPRTLKAWGVAATYDLGVAQVRVMATADDDGAASATKRTGNGVGVTFPMGAAALGFLVTNRTTKTTSTTVDLEGYQLNARYNLSKRTNVYLHHGTDKDTGSAVTASTQNKRTRTLAGLVHTF